jgi:ABC-type uncharacterized transport system permease subunit
VIHTLVFLSYLGAFVLWLLLLWRGSSPRGTAVAAALTAFATVLHFTALLSFWRATGELPLVGPGAALSSLAFVGGIALVAMLPLREGKRVVLGLLPFILLLQGVALVLGIRPSPLILDHQGLGFILHVALAFLGYQGFAIAFAAGALYLAQHHELKEKRFGRFFSFLPPLATLDRVGRAGGWIGFSALTLSLLIGWAWTVKNRGSFELASPKVLWAIFSWFAIVVVLALRHGRGSTEVRSAIAAIAAFGAVLVCYVLIRIASAESGLFL